MGSLLKKLKPRYRKRHTKPKVRYVDVSNKARLNRLDETSDTTDGGYGNPKETSTEAVT